MRIASLASPFLSKLLAGLAAGAVGLSFAGTAGAVPLNLSNGGADVTNVIPFANGIAAGGPTDVIGNGFNTSSMGADRVVFGGPGAQTMVLTLTFNTEFNGDNGTGAHYADVFLRVLGGPGSAFNYGIALGYQSGHGGVAANLFSLTSAANYQTSNQIWTGTGGTYGGKFVETDVAQSPSFSPTRVLTGTDIGNVTATSAVGGTGYLVTAIITTTNTTLINAPAFDIFWGTGDCSNDAVLVSAVVPGGAIPTPEPASLAVLGVGLLGLGMTTRRRRA